VNQQDAGRLAIGVILGVVGAVAITKEGLSPRECVVRWLIFALMTCLSRELISRHRAAVAPGLRSYSLVMVMQSAEFRDLDHPAPFRRMHSSRIRCVHR